MPGNEDTVRQHSIQQQEHAQLPGQISRYPEVKLGIQWGDDNKGVPIEFLEYSPTTYHFILCSAE